MCSNYRKDLDSCRKGCIVPIDNNKFLKVNKGDMCPYVVEDQYKCPCYNK